MSRFLLLFTGFLLITAALQAQMTGTYNDPRDGNEYYWVKVGKQVWMAENLRYQVVGSWAYNYDSIHEMKFGRLYSWDVAQSACPKGWHLPAPKEWNALIQTLGGPDEAGGRMQQMDTLAKRTDLAATGSPNPKISSLFSGIRYPDMKFSSLNLWGGCWSTVKVNDSVAENYLFARGSKSIVTSTNARGTGLSVRCVRNK
ncbi:MAG TPA: FISUMP domain-containing protein [Bacteroidales bacterium]|nr:FISUMP domain-containing protein [Bacteroidales bacterium]